MRKVDAILVAAIVTAALEGCNTNGCMENRNSVPLAGFYAYATGESIALDSVQIAGVGMPEDDPLSPAGRNINKVYLPMRSTQQTTSWVFSYKWKELDDARLNDTITFAYDSSPYFASSECGVIYKYQINNVEYSRHLIDSIGLADSLITNLDVEQIKIFFRVEEEPGE